MEFAIKPRENGNSYSEGDIKMHGNKFGVAFGRTAGGAVKINSDAIRTHFHIQIYDRVRAASLPQLAGRCRHRRAPAGQCSFIRHLKI